MTLLYSPDTYKNASRCDKKATCNGCGSKGFGGWVVPDTLWGLDIEEVCNIHDWMYSEGKTIEDKDKADRVMLNNMIRLIEKGTRWLRRVRRMRAKSYYKAVKYFGGSAFWDDKN